MLIPVRKMLTAVRKMLIAVLKLQIAVQRMAILKSAYTGTYEQRERVGRGVLGTPPSPPAGEVKNHCNRMHFSKAPSLGQSSTCPCNIPC
jgi:hypothetical protein